MATHHPSTPPAGIAIHHGPPGGPPPGIPAQRHSFPMALQIAATNEAVWIQIGSLAESLNNSEEAISAYEHAMRVNPRSISAMSAMSGILRSQEQFYKAVEYLQNILKLEPNNGEVWGSLGHCFLMMDDLQQAYTAYQQALYHLQNPKEPKLWYGIGILYDRYGSLDHAEEAFSQVMRMQPDFEKANEIYFRLGIIYKQQQKYQLSLECFQYIVEVPPSPLTEDDIWFQIGHVYEQQKEFESARLAYRRVLDHEPNHAKVLQQLGWLYHQQSNNFSSQEQAIEYLEKSVNSDQSDAQSWYLLGRCYMSQQKYPKAYEAYQQAVYRDGRNPTFWCSIGVLYYQINQYRDALDAYTRAIRLNPFISEVWYDLGTLYESCNNQVSDAIDAYERAQALDQTNTHIKSRLQLLRTQQANGLPIPTSAPLPQDVHPQAYQPSGTVGPPGPQWGNSAAPPPQQPGPPGGPNGWGNRLAEINPSVHHNANQFEQRDPSRIQTGPVPTPPPRSGLDQMRPYPGPSPRGHLPPPPPLVMRSPHDHFAAMGPYPGSGQSQAGAPQLPQRNNSHHQQPQLPRVSNPNYAGPGSTKNMHSAPNGVNPTTLANSLPPFGRSSSPRTETRSIHHNRMLSPKSGYLHQPSFQHHLDNSQQGGMESGKTMPTPGLAAMVAAEAATSEWNGDHPRPSSVGPKRLREWDEDQPILKKTASDETRARLMDSNHRRTSTPPREPSFCRGSSEIRRGEDQRHLDEQRRIEDQRREDQRREDQRRMEDQQRRANEGYHPSEVVHHPQLASSNNHLPSLQQGPPLSRTPVHEIHPPPGPKEYPPEERERERHEHLPPISHPNNDQPERAKRKMEVDENYDDDGDEEKKTGVLLTAGSGSVSASSDVKATSPSGVNGHAVNGVGNIKPKIEA